MIKKLQLYHLFIFSWLILNIIQAAYTQLTSDEGYYWFYAHKLEWGYYDHPPMVALIIKFGSLLFKGELGVRFINVLFSTGAVFLFYQLLPAALRNSNRIFVLLLSCPLITYLAFIVFPDGPLLFFSLLFLFIYRRFLDKEDVATAIILGVCMALMFYSKYHGVLLVLFTVVANLRLLRSFNFYFACIVACVLFIPHIIWQYEHQFVTLGYHLSGRTDPVSFHHVFEYISQQIPAIGLGLFFVPFVYKAKDVFDRTLRCIIIGTFIFFLFSSLKTFVHFHWTSIALFPLMLLAASYYTGKPRSRLFRWLIIPFAVLVIVVRLQLLFNFLPVNHANVDYYKGRDLWARDIAKIAENRPVFFPSNLREASLYSFYSGGMAVTLYGRPEKKTQYDLWNYEDSLQHKDVLYVSLDTYPGGKALHTRMGQTVYYKIIPSFQSYYDLLPITVTNNNETSDSVIYCSVTLNNLRKYEINFEKNTDGQQPLLFYSIERGEEELKLDTLKLFNPNDHLAPGERRKLNFNIPVKQLISGKYRILFGFRFGILPDAYNSNNLSYTKR